MLSVRKATREDVFSIAQRLRKEDLLEIQASGSASPEEALLVGLESPDVCFVAVDSGDVPQIIFGSVPSHDPIMGYVWMMGTDEIRENWVQVLRQTHYWLEKVSDGYQLLSNAVHSDNKLHIKWLRWAGFHMLRKLEVNGHVFYEFAKLVRGS